MCERMSAVSRTSCLNALPAYLVDEGDGKGGGVGGDLGPSNDLGFAGVPGRAVLGLADRVGCSGGSEGEQSGSGETEHGRVNIKEN